MLNADPVAADASLHGFLGRLQQSLLDADETLPTDIAERLQAGAIAGFGVAERIGIYRHAYRMRLAEALRETFGHCAQYLDAQFDGKGDSAFDRLALAYVQSHPSLERNINHYGRNWPAWLAEHLAQWPELADLASLDWQLRRAFDGPDGEPLQLAVLAERIAQPGWERLALRPVPTFERLRFSTNALALWHAIDEDAVPPAAERLPEPVAVMVWRVEHRPHFRSVDPFEAEAIDALLREGSFGAMCERLAEQHQGTAPDGSPIATAAGALLRRWIDEALLAA